MKTTTYSTLKLFRSVFATLAIVLTFTLNLLGQDHSTNISSIKEYVNIINNNVEQVQRYGEQAYNATDINEVKLSAKQMLVLLEETKNIIHHAETVLTNLSTPENKEKCGKYFNAIASDLVDFKKRVEYAIYKANEITTANESGDVKRSATAIITEAKKMKDITTESSTHISLAEQRLTSID